MFLLRFPCASAAVRWFSMSSWIFRKVLIVAISPAIRFRPPMIEGAMGWIETGNVL
jgi:hypothetical protein